MTILINNSTSDGLTKNGNGCTDYDTPDINDDSGNDLVSIPDGDLLSKTAVCIDGAAYWVVQIHVALIERSCNIEPDPPCDIPTLQVPAGFDQLDGSKFGGLTRDMIAGSAVASWKKNGQKNGWPSSDPATAEGMEDIFDNGINAMGLVNIPVCSFSEGVNNAFPDTKTPNWPCN